ncbi:RNA polymerase sigma factor SigJ [Acidithiobacillus thiooxidans]|uniref:RNA polymerase sigma factor SigJ n=1 Tax=Acidithiobacillus thiooxidans TaxID=930 RepID=UPI001C06AADA|nr:RNA polymerase sigma factor SigJ [Acidithiobacillus thiooxidans]MBU2751317.1 RNA polymerase sigma factor SigJ [Acidithiobacillus thiooxidans]
MGNNYQHDLDEPVDNLRHTLVERRRLVLFAYNILGSATEAEDAVQEMYLRWYRLSAADRAKIETAIAWNRTVLTRVCLDKLKSFKSRREVYVGEWLPEPIPNSGILDDPARTPQVTDPSVQLELSQTVSMALLIVLEKMIPAERVSFILHDVFQYSFSEIAEMIERTPQACRQLASSARKRLTKEEVLETSDEEHARLNSAFRQAWMLGDIRGLVSVLDKRACAITDGGGVVSASIEPIIGAEAIALFFLSIFERQPDLVIEEVDVNGKPGLIGSANGKIIAVISSRIRNGVFSDIWAVRNPEKLRIWQ